MWLSSLSRQCGYDHVSRLEKCQHERLVNTGSFKSDLHLRSSMALLLKGFGILSPFSALGSSLSERKDINIGIERLIIINEPTTGKRQPFIKRKD